MRAAPKDVEEDEEVPAEVSKTIYEAIKLHHIDELKRLLKKHTPGANAFLSSVGWFELEKRETADAVGWTLLMACVVFDSVEVGRMASLVLTVMACCVVFDSVWKLLVGTTQWGGHAVIIKSRNGIKARNVTPPREDEEPQQECPPQEIVGHQECPPHCLRSLPLLQLKPAHGGWSGFPLSAGLSWRSGRPRTLWAGHS